MLTRAHQVLLAPFSVLTPSEKVVIALILLRMRYTAPFPESLNLFHLTFETYVNPSCIIEPLSKHEIKV